MVVSDESLKQLARKDLGDPVTLGPRYVATLSLDDIERALIHSMAFLRDSQTQKS